MLDGLETKLVAAVADAVTGRANLDVVQSAGPGDDPTAGRTVARIGVDSVAPERGFDRDVIEVTGPSTAPVSRRVLPVQFVAAAHFAARPTDGGAPARTAARTQLVGDVSAVAHAVAGPTFVAGSAFAVEGDPGFTVRSFALADGDLDPDPVAGDDPALLRAVLHWDGRAIVWPTSPPGPEGVMLGVDVALNATPLVLSAAAPVVTPGRRHGRVDRRHRRSAASPTSTRRLASRSRWRSRSRATSRPPIVAASTAARPAPSPACASCRSTTR